MNNCVTVLVALTSPEAFCNAPTISLLHLCSQLSPSSQSMGTQRKPDSEPCQLKPFPDGSMPQGSRTALHSILPMSSCQMSLEADSIKQPVHCYSSARLRRCHPPESQHSVRAWKFSICPARAQRWDSFIPCLICCPCVMTFFLVPCLFQVQNYKKANICCLSTIPTPSSTNACYFVMAALTV